MGLGGARYTRLVASHVSAKNMMIRPVRLKCASPALAMPVPTHSATTEKVTRREGTSMRVMYSIATTKTGVNALRLGLRDQLGFRAWVRVRARVRVKVRLRRLP